jgi:hypothetical protein
MSLGIPCRNCGFMKATHTKRAEHFLFYTTPCGNYQPLETEHMMEIERTMSQKGLTWVDVLPCLGTTKY